ncbi:hypothetical protein B7494_g4262 [Chlorociboria aeruginascens]|nr:hypothetical protein B7494_g4262 [Chlorociboria aeruginascens]
MNCPSKTDEPLEGSGYNQNPNPLSADLTTRADLNGMANLRMLKRSAQTATQNLEELPPENLQDPEKQKTAPVVKEGEGEGEGEGSRDEGPRVVAFDGVEEFSSQGSAVGGGGERGSTSKNELFAKIRKILVTFGKFIGPGFMISVAYIDPGNYATDVAAGATFRFRLLFIVLMSNIFAIFLQSLCIKLGTIIATDIAEVIGTAIAINLLIPKIPLVAGCALSIVDVLFILLFYNPSGSMRGLRAFELFVVALVLGVVICFCIQLSLIKDTSVGEIFRGYLPSSAIVQSKGLYQSCGILGATVMPHSLYLGSGIVQPRLQEYDTKKGFIRPSNSDDGTKQVYQPSLSAINYALKYSIAELAFALFTFALFVNSAILIVAGASLSGIGSAANADLFGIYALLSSSISPAAGTIFALALLLSGISAGIVCTIAGQMVSEGALNWTISPWLRRLLTRSISITPSIIIAGAVGGEGLSAALNGSQVALSIVLPFVTAPLIYFTCKNKYMTVRPAGVDDSGIMDGNSNENGSRGFDGGYEENGEQESVKMRNHWITATLAILVWLVITIMNVANLVLLGKGGS